jgi:hypothetical protein
LLEDRLVAATSEGLPKVLEMIFDAIADNDAEDAPKPVLAPPPKKEDPQVIPMSADESAEAGALQSDLAAGVTASVLGVHDRNGGIPIYVNGVTKAFNDGGKIKGPVAIFAPLSKYNDPLIYQLYQFWAGVKRGSRLNAQGKPDIFTEDDVKRADA